jgi:hypothetical protein
VQRWRTLYRGECDLPSSELISAELSIYACCGVCGQTMTTVRKIEIYGRKSEFADVYDWPSSRLADNLLSYQTIVNPYFAGGRILKDRSNVRQYNRDFQSINRSISKPV